MENNLIIPERFMSLEVKEIYTENDIPLIAELYDYVEQLYLNGKISNYLEVICAMDNKLGFDLSFKVTKYRIEMARKRMGDF